MNPWRFAENSKTGSRFCAKTTRLILLSSFFSVAALSCSGEQNWFTFPRRFKERVVQRHSNDHPAWIRTYDLKTNELKKEIRFDEYGIQLYEGALELGDKTSMVWWYENGRQKSSAVFDQQGICLEAKLWYSNGQIKFVYHKPEYIWLDQNGGVADSGEKPGIGSRIPVWDYQGNVIGFSRVTGRTLNRSEEKWIFVDQEGNSILTGTVEVRKDGVRLTIRVPNPGWKWADPTTRSGSPDIIVQGFFSKLKGDMIDLSGMEMFNGEQFPSDPLGFRQRFPDTHKSQIYLSQFLKRFSQHSFQSQKFRKRYNLRFDANKSFSHEWESSRSMEQTEPGGINKGLYQMNETGETLILYYLDGAFRGETHLVSIKNDRTLYYPFREARYFSRRGG